MNNVLDIFDDRRGLDVWHNKDGWLWKEKKHFTFKRATIASILILNKFLQINNFISKTDTYIYAMLKWERKAQQFGYKLIKVSSKKKSFGQIKFYFARGQQRDKRNSIILKHLKI
jgi:hypothetical protein